MVYCGFDKNVWKSFKKVEKVAEEIGYPGFDKNVWKNSKKVEKVAEKINYYCFDKKLIKICIDQWPFVMISNLDLEKYNIVMCCVKIKIGDCR